MNTLEIRDKLTGAKIEQHIVSGSLLAFFEKEINGFDISIDAPFSLFVDDKELTKDKWDYTLEDGQKAIIYPEPKGVAAAVLSLVVKAAVTYAVNYAVNALFGTTDNYNETTPEGSSIYSVNAQGNSARLNGVVPQIFGKHAYYPDLISQPWATYDDDVEYLHMLFSCGVGEYDFEEVNIGNTPVSGYEGDIDYTIFQPGEDVTSHPAHKNVYTSLEVDGFELEGGSYEDTGVSTPSDLRYSFREIDFFGGETYARVIAEQPDGLGGWEDYTWPFSVDDLINIESTPYNYGYYKVKEIDGNELGVVTTDDDGINFDNTTNVSAVINGVTEVDIGEYFGPFLTCPSSTTTTETSIDLLYVGLGQINNDGDLINKTVVIDIEWREVGTEDWTVIPISKSGTTRDQLGDTIVITHPYAMTPEVRIRRMTSKAIATSTVFDEVQWVRLKSELEANTSYEHWTTLAVKIKATNALSSSAQNKFNTVQTRKLPVYDAVTETWSDATATQDIAPAFAYIIKDSGLDDSVLDLENMDDLNTIWAGREDFFNAVYDSDYTLFDSLKKLLAVGYAEPIIDNGQIKATRDAVRSDYGQFFSYDNTTSISESGTLFVPDEPDGVTVEYFSNETWKTETVDCLLDGDLGEQPEEVRAFGITDKTKAWRYGMRIRRAKRYIRRLWTIGTELEALNANVGDLVSVPNRRTQTGYLEDYVGNYLYLNTSVDFEDGETYYIGIRKPDGTLSGPYVCTPVFNEMTVEISTELDFTPVFDTAQDNPLFKFGTLEQWHTPAIVRSIEPDADESATLELSLYDSRVYEDDDNFAP